MIKHFYFAALALLCFVGAAAASDLPTHKGPLPAPVYALYSWTGFYIGGQFGGAWNESAWSQPPGSIFSSATFGTPGSGFLYGGQAGYSYQINQFVLGAEGDFGGTTEKGDATCVAPRGPVAGTTCQTKQDWLASIRGRVGFALDRLLFYGDGGVAFTDFHFAETTLLHQSFGGGSRTGWTIGLGVEYAFTDHITGGVEYNCYDFGAENGLLPVVLPQPSSDFVNPRTL